MIYEQSKAVLLPLAAKFAQASSTQDAAAAATASDSVVVTRTSSVSIDTATLEQTEPMRHGAPSQLYVPYHLQLATHLASGFIAGAVGAALTNPVDVARTRIQVESARAEGAYTGIVDAVKRIAKEEGWKAFAKGMSARILWMAPGAAISIAACTFV